MRWIALLALIGLAACDVPQTPVSGQPGHAQPRPPQPPRQTLQQAARNFVSVVGVLEPVAERECRARTSGLNCDFRIVVDDNPKAPSNAFQSVDRTGRPLITFTLPLIAETRNSDEIAFVMGHEAAHHIAGHLDRQRKNAAAGALILSGLAAVTGGNRTAVESAQRVGAAVGARSYSKNFELEADKLGTVIAYKAGYDPLLGAQFFSRIPDPGDHRFLGTHPPNASRAQVVQSTVRTLRGN